MIDKTLARMIDESLRICRQSEASLRRKPLESHAEQAHLVLMGGDNFQAEVEQIAATLNGERPGQVLTLPVGVMEHTACHYHPSLKDQKMMADGLQSLLDRHPEIWGRMK